MCSSPRPRKKIQGRVRASGSILSSMSVEARRQFTERANHAQERRYEMAINEKNKKNQQIPSVRVVKKVEKNSLVKLKSSLSYWLLTASLKDIFTIFFSGSLKRT